MGCANTFTEERNCLIIKEIKEKYIISNENTYIQTIQNVLCRIENNIKNNYI